MMYRVTAFDNKSATLEYFGNAPTNMVPVYVGLPETILRGIADGSNLHLKFSPELAEIAMGAGGFVKLFAVAEEIYGEPTEDTDGLRTDTGTADGAADAGTITIPAEAPATDGADEPAVPAADSKPKRSIFSKPAAVE